MAEFNEATGNILGGNIVVKSKLIMESGAVFEGYTPAPPFDGVQDPGYAIITIDGPYIANINIPFTPSSNISPELMNQTSHQVPSASATVLRYMEAGDTLYMGFDTSHVNPNNTQSVYVSGTVVVTTNVVPVSTGSHPPTNKLEATFAAQGVYVAEPVALVNLIESPGTVGSALSINMSGIQSSVDAWYLVTVNLICGWA
jgi:hypothetical protein